VEFFGFCEMSSMIKQCGFLKSLVVLFAVLFTKSSHASIADDNVPVHEDNPTEAKRLALESVVSSYLPPDAKSYFSDENVLSSDVLQSITFTDSRLDADSDYLDLSLQFPECSSPAFKAHGEEKKNIFYYFFSAVAFLSKALFDLDNPPSPETKVTFFYSKAKSCSYFNTEFVRIPLSAAGGHNHITVTNKQNFRQGFYRKFPRAKRYEIENVRWCFFNFLLGFVWFH
jgi:hypothetical protein